MNRTRPMTENEARRVLTVHFQTAALAIVLTATATAAAVLLAVAFLTN